MSTIQEIRASVERFHTQLREVVQSAPESSIHWKEREDTWSVAQILAHVAEFERFFVDDAQRVKSAPGRNFGRTMADEQRLAAVHLSENETLEQLLDKVSESREYVLTTLSDFVDDDLAIPCVNPKFGEKNIDWLLGHFIVEHLEKHVGQLQRTIQAYQEQIEV